MPVSSLTEADLEILLSFIGKHLSCDNTAELRDVLFILSRKGAISLSTSWDSINIYIPSVSQDIIRLSRAKIDPRPDP